MHRNAGRQASTIASSIALALLAAAPAVGDGPQDPSAFIGTWRLDRDASEPIAPLMEALGAPWLARKLADSMTPTLRITASGAAGLRMLNENPIRTADRRLPIDGVARTRKDALGRRVVSSESWNDAGELVVREQTSIGGDRIVRVTSTWTRVGDRLELRFRLRTPDGPLEILRIFRPVPGAGERRMSAPPGAALAPCGAGGCGRASRQARAGQECHSHGCACATMLAPSARGPSLRARVSLRRSGTAAGGLRP